MANHPHIASPFPQQFIEKSMENQPFRSLAVAFLCALLAACTGSMPTTEDGCSALSAATERDECLAAIAPTVFAEDPQKGEQLILKIEDPNIRDFVYLTITRTLDPGNPTWCQRIQEPALKQRCMVLVSRPHLHRELLKESGRELHPPPPNGPPPGANRSHRPGGPPPHRGPPPKKGGKAGPPPPAQGDDH